MSQSLYRRLCEEPSKQMAVLRRLGLYVADDSKASDYGYLEDWPHTSYRAEIRALLAAVARPAEPISAMIDNGEVFRRFDELDC